MEWLQVDTFSFQVEDFSALIFLFSFPEGGTFVSYYIYFLKIWSLHDHDARNVNLHTQVHVCTYIDKDVHPDLF